MSEKVFEALNTHHTSIPLLRVYVSSLGALVYPYSFKGFCNPPEKTVSPLLAASYPSSFSFFFPLPPFLRIMLCCVALFQLCATEQFICCGGLGEGLEDSLTCLSDPLELTA